MLPALLLAAMVVLNSTADVRVPLQVSVGGQQNAATPAVDNATLAGLIGLAGTFVYRWRKSDKRADKFNNRTVVSAETTMTQAESLKATDMGIEEMLGGISKAINLIPGIPEDAKKILSTQLEAWQADNKAYYVNTPAKPTDLSTDMVVKKLGEVQKISEKNTL